MVLFGIFSGMEAVLGVIGSRWGASLSHPRQLVLGDRGGSTFLASGLTPLFFIRAGTTVGAIGSRWANPPIFPHFGALTSGPAAVSWGPNHIDVFARGPDNGVYKIIWDGHSWSAGAPLGGAISYRPAVSSWGVELVGSISSV
jgi:hypothetical protein